MKYVAIDTCGANLIILINNGEKTFTFQSEGGLGKHSGILLPKIEEMLENASMKIGDVDFFACVVGAGSFTGIRIGVSTITALAFSLNKPVLRITSFDCLAYNITSGKRLAVIDAKHDGYYVCGYDGDKVVLEEQYIEKDSLLSICTAYQMVSETTLAGFDVVIVDKAVGCEKAIDKKVNEITTDLSVLTPLYCRKSQAEEGR